MYQTYDPNMCKGDHFNTIRTPAKKFVPPIENFVSTYTINY